MKKSAPRRLLVLFLTFLMLVSILPKIPAQAAGDAMSLNEVEELLNAQTLYPRKTGYAEMDALLAGILKPYEDKDTYTKIKAMYDWTLYQMWYSWEGYSQDYAPAYDCFTLKYNLTYETGLPKAIPDEMIHRSYHALTAKKGVCYDWAALFAIMARYVGIDSYVHTGMFKFEDEYIPGASGHHGWTELVLNGKNYIFDPQRDWFYYARGYGVDYRYFGISYEKAWRYQQETEANTKRDAGFLPVAAERIRVADVTVTCSRSGSVSGAGSQPWGGTVTLTSATGKPVVGWYDKKENLLSTDPTYSFTLNGPTELYAVFEGDYFVDVKDGAWYEDDVTEAAARGLFNGMTPITFEANTKMSRAMVVAVLARAAGADTASAPSSPFRDVPAGAWYAGGVNWAYEAGIVKGVSATAFRPNSNVTREQFAVLVVRFLNTQGVTGEAESLSFTDAGRVSGYAKDAMEQAVALGILEGYEDNTVRPQSAISRAEAAVMLVRTLRVLEGQSAGELQSAA